MGAFKDIYKVKLANGQIVTMTDNCLFHCYLGNERTASIIKFYCLETES